MRTSKEEPFLEEETVSPKTLQLLPYGNDMATQRTDGTNLLGFVWASQRHQTGVIQSWPREAGTSLYGVVQNFFSRGK